MLSFLRSDDEKNDVVVGAPINCSSYFWKKVEQKDEEVPVRDYNVTFITIN